MKVETLRLFKYYIGQRGHDESCSLYVRCTCGLDLLDAALRAYAGLGKEKL